MRIPVTVGAAAATAAASGLLCLTTTALSPTLANHHHYQVTRSTGSVQSQLAETGADLASQAYAFAIHDSSEAQTKGSLVVHKNPPTSSTFKSQRQLEQAKQRHTRHTRRLRQRRLATLQLHETKSAAAAAAAATTTTTTAVPTLPAVVRRERETGKEGEREEEATKSEANEADAETKARVGAELNMQSAVDGQQTATLSETMLISGDETGGRASSFSSVDSAAAESSAELLAPTATAATGSQQVLEFNALQAASHYDYFRHSPAVSVILTIAYTIVFIVGIIGNSFVVAIVCKSPRMRTVTNYFIANLAFADILVLLFCLPATLVGNLFIPYVLGLFVCKTVSYLQGVAVSASINTMVAVTMDRFLAICFPMDWHMSRRTARWTIACIWLFSLSISLPWALYFTLVPYSLDSHTIHVCAEDWPNEQMGSIYFVCANLILLYLFPATVIILCYLGIWYKIERRNIPGDRPQGLKIELIMQKSKLKVVKMMMVVVVIFLLSWLPLYLIFARIKLAEERSQWEDWLITKMMPLAQWLGASNSCINPILYTFFNRKYKRGFIDLLRFGFCCKPSGSQGSLDGNGNGIGSSALAMTKCNGNASAALANYSRRPQANGRATTLSTLHHHSVSSGGVRNGSSSNGGRQVHMQHWAGRPAANNSSSATQSLSDDHGSSNTTGANHHHNPHLHHQHQDPYGQQHQHQCGQGIPTPTNTANNSDAYCCGQPFARPNRRQSASGAGAESRPKGSCERNLCSAARARGQAHRAGGCLQALALATETRTRTRTGTTMTMAMTMRKNLPSSTAAASSLPAVASAGVRKMSKAARGANNLLASRGPTRRAAKLKFAGRSAGGGGELHQASASGNAATGKGTLSRGEPFAVFDGSGGSSRAGASSKNKCRFDLMIGGRERRSSLPFGTVDLQSKASKRFTSSRKQCKANATTGGAQQCSCFTEAGKTEETGENERGTTLAGCPFTTNTTAISKGVSRKHASHCKVSCHSGNECSNKAKNNNNRGCSNKNSRKNKANERDYDGHSQASTNDGEQFGCGGGSRGGKKRQKAKKKRTLAHSGNNGTARSLKSSSTNTTRDTESTDITAFSITNGTNSTVNQDYFHNSSGLLADAHQIGGACIRQQVAATVSSSSGPAVEAIAPMEVVNSSGCAQVEPALIGTDSIATTTHHTATTDADIAASSAPLTYEPATTRPEAGAAAAEPKAAASSTGLVAVLGTPGAGGVGVTMAALPVRRLSCPKELTEARGGGSSKRAPFFSGNGDASAYSAASFSSQKGNNNNEDYDEDLNRLDVDGLEAGQKDNSNNEDDQPELGLGPNDYDVDDDDVVYEDDYVDNADYDEEEDDEEEDDEEDDEDEGEDENEGDDEEEKELRSLLRVAADDENYLLVRSAVSLPATLARAGCGFANNNSSKTPIEDKSNKNEDENDLANIIVYKINDKSLASSLILPLRLPALSLSLEALDTVGSLTLAANNNGDDEGELSQNSHSGT